MNNRRDYEWSDPDLSALYQATPRVEPPATLDERILSASRAAVAPRPVSILSRFRTFRFWAAPVALAATLILAVGLTPLLYQASEQSASLDMQTPPLAKPAAEADAGNRQELKAADRALPTAPAPAAPAPAAPAPAASSLSLPMERRKLDLLHSAPASVKEEAAQPLPAPRSPEAWLAEIAELRRQGRTAEAEARLAEFRRYYPDYPRR